MMRLTFRALEDECPTSSKMILKNIRSPALNVLLSKYKLRDKSEFEIVYTLLKWCRSKFNELKLIRI